MAKDKNSFLVYSNWEQTFENLSDEEAGRLIKHLFRYVNDKAPTAPDRITELVFEPIKAVLKSDLKKYEKVKDDKSLQGRLGNLKRWNNDLFLLVENKTITLEHAEETANNRKVSLSDKKIATATKVSLNIADNVNDNGNVNDNDIKRAKALVVSPETPQVTKKEYLEIVNQFTGKEKKEVVEALKAFIQKRPEFLEPYADYWNIAVQGCSIPQVKSLSESRIKKLKTRIQEDAFDFCEIIKKIRGSTKLKTESNWFSFDWVFDNQTNYVKIIEGNYDN